MISFVFGFESIEDAYDCNISRRNRRVLNRVSVERFVLLMKKMEQAIARVLVKSKWEQRKQQVSDNPQDAQHDKQTHETTSSSASLAVLLFCIVFQERMVQVASTRVYRAVKPIGEQSELSTTEWGSTPRWNSQRVKRHWMTSGWGMRSGPFLARSHRVAACHRTS
jgi:hypothetical protein